MRKLQGEAAELSIQEREDYTLTLAREHSGEIQELALYGVILTTPIDLRCFYVLAESEEGAISQARCAASWEKHNVTPEVEAQTTIQVKRIPFIIRGWSGHCF